MILYIIILIVCLVLVFLSIRGLLLPKNISDNKIKFVKTTQIISIILLILAFLCFLIGELSEKIYDAFSIIGIVFAASSIIYYAYRNIKFKKNK